MASLARQIVKLDDNTRRKKEKDVLETNLKQIEVLHEALLSFQEEREALAASNLKVSLFVLSAVPTLNILLTLCYSLLISGCRRSSC